MGIIEQDERVELESSSCPVEFVDIFNTFSKIKFSSRTVDGKKTLVYREQLTYQDLQAYMSVTGDRLTIAEIDIVMGLDGIFEGRESK